MFHVLVVEDDKKLRRMMCTVLENSGYQTVSASDGLDALRLLEQVHIDVIVTDIMMPRMDGYELTRTLRDANYHIPILFVTAKDTFQDKQKGFLYGIDDYMVKPIDIHEMVLRVGALLRRARIVSERRLTLGSAVLDYDALTVNGAIALPQKEFYVLYMLASFPNKIFTRQQLMEEIWGPDSETDPRTVDVHINRLRDRLKEITDFEIVTVRGLGYKVVKRP